MRNKQMGPIQLGGLLAGAVLGSGVILLPPMAEARLGEWSVAAWLIVMALGAVFASLFARLAVAYPGSEGVPIAIREAFGEKAGQLASNYIICAVCVGPVAVMMTAADSIGHTFNLSATQISGFATIMVLICSFILLRRVTFVSTISLIASIAIGLILISGSFITIGFNSVSPIPVNAPDIPSLGSALLLLFWAIIGWEIIGNYSMEVRYPTRTIPLATIIGVSTVSVVYLLTGWAMHSIGKSPHKSLNVAQIVEPLLGGYANFMVMLITCALCICTYLMIIGGVSRLIATLAAKGKLPSILAKTNANNAPWSATFLLCGIHMATLFLLQNGVVSLEELVSFANVFFLANSLIAVGAALKIFKSPAVRIPCIILCTGFSILLAFSSIWPLLILAAVSIVTLTLKQVRRITFAQK
ncbi:APC family permease [Maridesulfovibrio salexigens]|uniref:Amino acid permease-associated region n=1 Tax=Maridesulfovibrio salexigens (strain ATCC 14822 / DSM 2638 / NCIMB 8403 / VKM B-1763) TaxID=526222 RepID=C6C1W8_MARSD|nr:amino acid permease [Maridesulfovibrio salexigens]ACS79364.1 amino acid permease-associated region [Maridesulfovibrio salexigens DSM 2638]